MNKTRVRRLLLLASKSRYNYKKRYAEYMQLEYEGLVTWQLGTAHITDKGLRWLWDYPPPAVSKAVMEHLTFEEPFREELVVYRHCNPPINTWIDNRLQADHYEIEITWIWPIPIVYWG